MSRSKAQLIEENKYIRKHGVGKQVTRIILELIRWGGYVVIARYIFLSIEAVAGTSTFGQIEVNSNFIKLTGKDFVNILSIVVGGSGIWYGKRQGKLRKDT